MICLELSSASVFPSTSIYTFATAATAVSIFSLKTIGRSWNEMFIGHRRRCLHMCGHLKFTGSGREPWPFGYGRRLMFRRSWVRISALLLDGHFFTYICCKNWNDVCLKRPKTSEKEVGVGPFFKTSGANFKNQFPSR